MKTYVTSSRVSAIQRRVREMEDGQRHAIVCKYVLARVKDYRETNPKASFYRALNDVLKSMPKVWVP